MAVAEGAGVIGSYQVRNLATVGGNVCNAAPSADMAPPLVALDADGGDRRAGGPAPAADLRLLHGRAPDGAPARTRCWWSSWSRPRGAQRRHLPAPHPAPRARHRGGGRRLPADHARTGRAPRRGSRSASVAPVIVRATEAEAALEGQAVTPALIERGGRRWRSRPAKPISDQRGSAEFRLHLVRVLTRRTLQTALERATGRSTSRNGAH